MTLEHVTITGNVAGSWGGGVDVYYHDGTLSFTDSIITGNYAGSNDEVDNINVQNAGGSRYSNNGSLIGENPGFVTPAIWNSTTLTNGTALDLHVRADSPYAEWFVDGDYIGAFPELGAVSSVDYTVVTTTEDVGTRRSTAEVAQ